MSESGKKWLLWGSILLTLPAIVGFFYGFSLTSISGDRIGYFSIGILIMSVLNLIFLISTKYQDRNGFKKTVKLLTYLFPLFLLFFYSIDIKWFTNYTDILYSVGLVATIALMPAALIYLFLIIDIRSVTGITIIIIYIILTLILKRISFGDQTPFLAVSFFLMGFGMYLLGLRCLMVIEKNKYLRVVSFIACLFIFLGSFGMIPLYTTNATVTSIIYSFFIFLLTLLVLLSIPVSGYIQWSPLHKKILKKILIPWIFILLIISVRFIFPDLNALFFQEKEQLSSEFKMRDYPILNKNGLEPD